MERHRCLVIETQITPLNKEEEVFSGNTIRSTQMSSSMVRNVVDAVDMTICINEFFEFIDPVMSELEDIEHIIPELKTDAPLLYFYFAPSGIACIDRNLS